ncbi:hypothetical protein CULC0102_2353 [Corynebacterium ulcerans 0102]|nr:hypothetical protein CULC809_00430 [Corynebacterium ulcerans 809]BAM26679.1 hypothetical protein CULC0102_2353 [Corynebacterium ulcerans 0102]
MMECELFVSGTGRRKGEWSVTGILPKQQLKLAFSVIEISLVACGKKIALFNG